MNSIKTTTLLTLRKQQIPEDLTNIILKFLECKADGCCNMDIYPLGKSYLDSRNLREVNWNYIIEFGDNNYHQDDCYCFEHMEVNMAALDDILGVEDDDDDDDDSSGRMGWYYSDDEIIDNISDNYSDGEILSDPYSEGEIYDSFLGWDFNASCDI